MDSQIIMESAGRLISMGLYVVTSFFFCRMLCCILPQKEGRFYDILIFISGIFIPGMVIDPEDMFNVTLDLVWLLLLTLFCFKGSVVSKLSVTAVIYPLIIALNFLVSDISLSIWLASGKSFPVDLAVTLLQGCIHTLFWYLIYRTFVSRVRQASRLYSRNTWILLGIICLASLVSITGYIYYPPEETYKIWPCAIACMATNIGSLYLAGYFVNTIQQEMEQDNLKLQRVYYEELERNQTEIRRFRHDMNHHLLVIRDLFDREDREAAHAYFRELESQIMPQNRCFCKNSVLNAVLNAKYSQAEDSGIDCFFHIDLPEVTAIDQVSLCSIFANTLDNAIEASRKISEPEKRRISVKARIADNGFFSYEIKNEKRNKVLIEKGNYISDKKNKSEHGMGLSNVQRTVEKYNGTLHISYDDTSFTVVILIGNAL